MTHRKTLLLMVCMFTAMFVTANLHSLTTEAGAQAPKVGQRWEYATFSYGEPVGNAAYGSLLFWKTGKKSFVASFEKDQPLPFAKLIKELGGKEDTASLGVLLDRIGQHSWELVTHAMRTGQSSVDARVSWTFHIWTFKRPVQ